MKKYWLEPNWETNLTIHEIPIKLLLNKNIKALLLDVDGTLLPRKEIVLHPSVENWLLEAKKHLVLHLISNNPSKKRIHSIAKKLRISCTYRASKPRKAKTIEAIKQLKYQHSSIAIVGDRIFTDILAGNRLGLYTILVRPIKADGTSYRKNHFQKLEKYISRLLGASKE